MSSPGARIVPLALALSLVALAAAHADRGRGKNKSRQYHGAHPLSIKAEAGFCYIEVPHVHPTRIHNKHKPLYRAHEGHKVFIADPVAYGYEGPRHSYYGHHPVAVDVVLGEEASFSSGQQLEFCYLDGPHYHLFAPQPGLSFTEAAGASWYIGELPEAYVEGKVTFAPVNRVYAKMEVERPEVVFEEPPTGYVGPLLDVHVHAPGAAVVVEPVGVEVHGHGHGHAEVRAGVEIHVPTPTLEIGLGIGGIAVDGHRHHKEHRKHKKHKKHRGKHKARHKRKGRVRPRW